MAVRQIPHFTEEDVNRFWSKVDRSQLTPGGCWEWQGATGGGDYGAFKHKRNQYTAHRCAYVIANGAIPSGLWILHRCDNPRCCNPDHLRPGTATDNNRDTVEKGRNNPYPGTEAARWKSRARAKLTYEKAKEIRATYVRGKVTQRKLAQTYGVTVSTIYAVLTKRVWAHE